MNQLRSLLDTHAFLWWLSGSSNLSGTARDAIANSENEVFVSAASAWEITTKHRLGRLPQADGVAQDVLWYVAHQGFRQLPISVRDAEYAGRMEWLHRDPFDRMLVAQAIIHDLALVSNERPFDEHGVSRIW